MARVLVLLVAFVALACCLEFPWSEWTRLDRSPAHQTAQFTLALKLENLDELDRLTERLTSPGSPEYRQWRTIEELNEITRPNPQKVRALLSFLEENNLSGEDYADFIKVSGTVEDIERAFDAEFYAFKNNYRVHNPVIIHRSVVHPTIPIKFRDLVMFITGVSNFPYPSRAPNTPKKYAAVDVGDYYTVPQTIRAQYSIPASYVASNSNSSQAVVEFGAQAGVSIDDLQQFMQLTDGDQSANLDYTVGNFQFHPIDPIDGESTLDVQYIMSVAPGVPTSFYVVDGWIYDFTTLIQERLSKSQPVPWIFSISYGWAESDQCSITGAGTGCGQLGGSSTTYVENTNNGLQKLGLVGISLFVSSGDSGAASSSNNDCKNTRVPIQPDYPASSNYVTAVGATMFSSAAVLSGDVPPFCTQSHITCAGAGQEVVCQVPEALITSGGGFSNVAATPSWQSAQVAAYLSSGALLPPTSDFNSSGRAYPDITALGHHYMIVENGRTLAVDGTSASAPVTAAIFALLQDNGFNSGAQAFGFLNPTLYSVWQSTPSILSDIIYGNNTTTEQSSGPGAPCTTVGYGAYVGYDATSGLGAPVLP